jgi:hypothetical protein
MTNLNIERILSLIPVKVCLTMIARLIRQQDKCAIYKKPTMKWMRWRREMEEMRRRHHLHCGVERAVEFRFCFWVRVQSR